MPAQKEEIVMPDDSSLEKNPNESSSGFSDDESGDRRKGFKLRSLRRFLALIIGLFIIIGSGLGYYAVTHSPKTKQNLTVNTQSLDNGTLNKLTATLGKNGQLGEELTISSNTTFKNGLAVQGEENVGNNLYVSGSSTLQGPVSAGSTLSVRGNASFGGNLSVSGLITAASLSVGSITISNLNFNGDLNFGGHLLPTGSQPTAVASVAASGGSVSISGNDTSGTVTITVGNNPPFLAGELAIITFHKAFNLTPQVQLTPDNDQGADTRYYVTQSPTFFTVRTASVPAAGAVFIFNYFVDQ